MKKKFNSLGVYIAVALLVALSLPVVLALTVLNETRASQIDEEMQRFVDEKLQTMQHSLILPVWSLDRSDMVAVLNGAMLDRQVVSVEILDPEGKSIIRLDDPQRGAGKLIARSAPLVMQRSQLDLNLGELRMVVSDEQLQRKLSGDKRFYTLVLLAQAVVSLLIIGGLVYRRILAPIGKLTEATERIQRGSFDARIAVPQQDEIGLLARHMEAMQGSLKTLFDEQAAILGNIPAGVLFVRDGRIAFFNGAAQALLGRHDTSLVGLPCEQVFVEPAQQAGYIAQTVARASGASGEIVLLRHGDGSSFPAELHTTLIEGGRQSDQIWVIIDVSQRLEDEARIDRLAFYDPVTDLPNKKLCMDRLRRGLGRMSSSGSCAAVMCIEVHRSDFAYGAVKADEAERFLVDCARRLSSCVSPDQTLARLEGEKFALLTELKGRELADGIKSCEALAHKLLAAFEDLQASLAGTSPCSLSVGINVLRHHDHAAEEVIMQAELAMVQARLAGRGVFRFFDPAMQALANQRSVLENELRQAVQQRQFVVHYQPQVSYEGDVVGAEALVRWQHPARDLVMPGHFIAVAEELGLMEEIGHQLLQQVCADMQAWQAEGLARDLVIAVNVSAQEFQSQHFVQRFCETLREHGIKTHSIKVELTESMMVDHVDEVIERMHALRAQAVSISLDDFGTGYSSLSYLGRFPIDQLKIDQSFVRRLHSDAATASIVRSIIMLGQSLELSIIAEGVETREQRDLLHAHGCTLYQGYWYGKPMPGEQFRLLLSHPQRYR
nr:EAL domain-containing protein [Herbaspirillum sp. ASV7]